MACLYSAETMESIGFPPMNFLTMVYGLLTYNAYYTEHLWFLPVLFVFFLIHYCLGKYGKSVAVVAITFLLMILQSNLTVPYFISKCMQWLIFFTAGRRLAETDCWLNESVRNKKKIAAAIMLVLFLVLVRLTGVTDIVGIDIAVDTINATVKCLIGFAGIYLIYAVCVRVNEKNDCFRNCVKKIGDESFIIYLMHNPYIVALSCIVLNKMLGINAIICVIVATSIGIIIPIIIDKLVVRRSKIISLVIAGR